MYWLLGGSARTIPGFVAGALIGVIVAIAFGAEIGVAGIAGIFSGALGETLHYFMRGDDRDKLES